ncbi:MAG TPA: S41 family peptidase [Armatimonadota bacterium]|nr:S41 family peptidase [Armatimonadota bacterium]
MKNKGLFPVIVTVAIAGSFAAGIFEPELRAQGGFPEVFSSLRPGANGRELDPLRTYNRVMQDVRDRFYGEFPGERKMTFTAIRGMLASLDDPYTRFLDPKEYAELRQENTGEFEGIGAQLEGLPTKEGYIRISRPIPNGPAAKAGVKRGDMITRVDGKSVQGMSVNEAVESIRGKAGTTVRLTLQRMGESKPIEVAITRQPVEFEVVDFSMKEGKVGYVSLAQFNELADPKLERAIRTLDSQGMKALVLDLRGNPGGLLDAAIDISSRFVPPGKGVVVIVESGGEKDVRRTNPQKHLRGRWPVVVLVNRTSASASEIVAGAVQDNKAGIVVGTTTFGKGLVQTVVPLEGGAACMITTAKYLTPHERDINRSRTQRGGVEPDVTVEVTEEQFNQNEDVQLKKALELLHEKIGYQPTATRAASKPAPR